MTEPRKFKARVDAVKTEAVGIRSYRLTNPDGGEMPQFIAGAHIDVYLANGLICQYSLCNPSWERDSYLIGVLLERSVVGGSHYIHNYFKVGDLVEISEPKLCFKLDPEAKRHLLIAGGIGVAPILAMAYILEDAKSDYVFHYCAKSRETAAFVDEIIALVKHGELHLHFDGGNPKDGLDLKATLREYSEGTHLYYCGPLGMMNATAEACSHWPENTVHYEPFSTKGIFFNPTKSE